MIPKTIHYCWFGRQPLPELAQQCIASWQRWLPDYDIVQWNEDNFDVGATAYTREAYALGRYAFVSDYARFSILHRYGGLYFDTDVEVVASLNDVLAAGPWLGREQPDPRQGAEALARVATGLGMATEAGDVLCGQMVAQYEQMHFITATGRIAVDTVVELLTRQLGDALQEAASDRVARVGDYLVYPPEYFCPLNYFTGQLSTTTNTRTIHHYAASWTHRSPSLLGRAAQRLKHLVVRARCNYFCTPML